MSDLAKKWIELEFVFSPAAAHARRHDLRKDIDWDDIDHYIRIGALATACALMEAEGLKGRDQHVRLLFELRNALIHNSGDISKNTNRNALQLAKHYLAQNLHLELSPELSVPFYSLHGPLVKLAPSLYFALRLCML